MIRTILVDDDLIHLRSLRNMLCKNFKQVEVIAVSNNVPDAVQKIDELKPQLVFLDVEMSPFTGFDLLEMIENRDFEVIFTTSYQKYAIQAIKTSALDYIEKPIARENLAESLQRYKIKTGQDRVENLLNNFKVSHENQRIALPDKTGLKFFEAGRIVCCKSDNSYTEFYVQMCREGKGEPTKILISKGLSYYEDFLIGKGFFYRVHNQYIVNINYIKRFVKDDGPHLILDSFSGIIPVARNRKDDFIKFLKAKGMFL